MQECNGPSSTFLIRIGQESLYVSSMFAAIQSETIRDLFTVDPLADEIIVDLKPGNYSAIKDYIDKNRLKCSPKDSVNVLQAALYLRMTSLTSEILKKFQFKLNDLLDCFEDGVKYGADVSLLASILSSNLQKLLKMKKFQKIDPISLDLLLQYPESRLSMDQIFSIISDKVEIKSDLITGRLVKYYPFASVKKSLSKQLLSNPKFNFNLLRDQLLKYSEPDIIFESFSPYSTLTNINLLTTEKLPYQSTFSKTFKNHNIGHNDNNYINNNNLIDNIVGFACDFSPNTVLIDKIHFDLQILRNFNSCSYKEMIIEGRQIFDEKWTLIDVIPLLKNSKTITADKEKISEKCQTYFPIIRYQFDISADDKIVLEKYECFGSANVYSKLN